MKQNIIIINIYLIITNKKQQFQQDMSLEILFTLNNKNNIYTFDKKKQKLKKILIILIFFLGFV